MKKSCTVVLSQQFQKVLSLDGLFRDLSVTVVMIDRLPLFLANHGNPVMSPSQKRTRSTVNTAKSGREGGVGEYRGSETCSKPATLHYRCNHSNSLQDHMESGQMHIQMCFILGPLLLFVIIEVTLHLNCMSLFSRAKFTVQGKLLGTCFQYHEQ